jgi:hypothetical protein
MFMRVKGMTRLASARGKKKRKINRCWWQSVRQATFVENEITARGSTGKQIGDRVDKNEKKACF